VNHLGNAKPHGELRQSALINTFGPGAMTDLPDYSVLVCGLDYWFGSHPQEEVSEPRLSRKIAELLQVPSIRLRTAPATRDGDDNPKSGVPVFRFPEWFVTQDSERSDGGRPGRSRFLVHGRALSKGKFRHPETDGGLNVVPVRFVRACRRGHIGDIDWYFFLHGNDNTCREQGRLLYMDERGTSGDLSEIYIRCSCGQAERSMAPVAIRKAEVFGRCDGSRPWLGPDMKECCDEMNQLLVRTASNAWFPQRMSVISLPERSESVREAVSAAWDFLEAAESDEDVARERKKAKVKEALQVVTDAEVWAEIQARRGALKGEERTIKAAELETLLATTKEIGDDGPDGAFHARTLPVSQWNRPWIAGIEKIVLIQRLREVTALLGFTRFEPLAPDIEGELDMDVRHADLACEISWVPAVENKGEGVFIQFRKSAIQEWLKRPAVGARLMQLKRGFDAWKAEHQGSNRDFRPEYIMLHSFAHLLITSVTLKCGYPPSSMRERIYALPAVGYGVLIYTGSSDAEGTLGGLTEFGLRIANAIHSALELGRLCSNDPVCSRHVPESAHEHRFLRGAACHGCVLIGETSCEQQNDLLDRALVVRTVQNSGAEFFVEPQA
jgi:hypothetical protein